MLTNGGGKIFITTFVGYLVIRSLRIAQTSNNMMHTFTF